MRRFEFRVRQYPIAAGTHSWEANELESPCDPIPLPEGGKAATTGESLVGKYPEIQDHLSRAHGVDIALIYVPSLDKFQELLTEATNGHFVVRGPRSSCMIFLGSSQV
jgi:hypothetical protein